MGKRVCRKCREEIQRKATVCPHCRSRQGWTLGAKLGLTLLALLVLPPLLVLPTLFVESRPSSSATVTMARTHAPSQRTEPAGAPSPRPKRYVVINDEGPAPVRWTAGSTNPKSVMARIPSGRRVEVHDQEIDRRGLYPVIYYEVGEGTERGWISQYTTTLELITVDPKTGKQIMSKQTDGTQQFARGSR